MKDTIFNFRTERDDFMPEANDDWSDYIPQTDKAQALYSKYLSDGLVPVGAAMKVLLDTYPEK